MPRVHGIDIGPRRGRGRGRGRPRPTVSFGGGGNVAASTAIAACGNVNLLELNKANSSSTSSSSPLANFSMALDDSPENSLQDIHGATLRMSLDVAVNREGDSNTGGNHLKSAAAMMSSTAPSRALAAPIPASKKASESEEVMATSNEQIVSPTKAAGLAKVNATTESSSALSATKENGINIRPLARESLNQLEFGSHSFSVQEISHKKHPPRINSNDLRFSSVGLAPSLEPIAKKMPPTEKESETTQLSLVVGNGEAENAQPSVETPAVNSREGNNAQLKQTQPPSEKTRLASETADLMASETEAGHDRAVPGVEMKSTRQSPSKPNNHDAKFLLANTIDATETKLPHENPNANWLYHRCSTACLQMETPLTPLELAIKTLEAIRSITDDDEFEEGLQPKLFTMLKDGKRRDLDFVFDVYEKAFELREDATLDYRSLQAVAAVAGNYGNCEVYDDHLDDEEIEAHDTLATQPIDPSTAVDTVTKSLNQLPGTPNQLQQQQTGDSPRKKHRSRRKKRPTKSLVANNSIHNEGMELLHTNETRGTRNNDATTKVNDTNDETAHADFPIVNDSLDIQDDERWSFLPTAQLQSIEEKGENKMPSPRRVTRSMRLTNNDNDVAVCNSVGDSSKADKCNEVTNEDQCIEKEVVAMETDNATDAIEENVAKNEDGATEADNLAGVIGDGVAGGNDKQDKAMETSNTIDDAVEDSLVSMRVENSIQSNEKQDEAIKRIDVSDDIDNTPCRSEESHIGDKEVYTVVKTRKRGEGKETVRIMFTGITATRRHMQMIETIGAEFVDSIEEAHTATHVIASDGRTKLRRTPKLMICLCRVSKILSMEWLEQSAKEQRVLDCHDFLLLGDEEAEKRYKFSMKETIRNGILARKNRGGVLGGWFVMICSGVAGNKAPNMKEMHLIIEAAGGQVLKSLSNKQAVDPLKTIVLTSDPSTKSQLNERGVGKFKGLGAQVRSTSWLFHTIVTQNLFDVDIEHDAKGGTDVVPTNGAGPPMTTLVRCNSHESLTSTISNMTMSPVKRGTARGSRHVANAAAQASNTGRNDDASVRSSSSRGSRVSNLERAPHPPPSSSKLQKKKINFEVSKPSPNQKCMESITRDQFLPSYQSTLISSAEAISATEDMAAAQTRGLWLDFFDEVVDKVSPASRASKSVKRPKKGVRCRRGRKRSISPLVSSTTPRATSASKHPSTTTRKILLEDNPFVTWEAYVLFTLAHRSEKLGFHEPFTFGTIVPASCFFPRPIAINDGGITEQGMSCRAEGKKLCLNVDARQSDRHDDETLEVFGTLQDVFSLHQQYQSSGMIPEQVIALLSLQAIKAVSAMHACRVVHNDIGLDSFLVVKRVQKKTRRKKVENEADTWFLQLKCFGYKSRVLNCEQQCQEGHYEHDYHCLANVIHLLLTGGSEITLNTMPHGPVEFTSKAFIKGNLFLRGALSWCSLIDALVCSGEMSPTHDSTPFKLHYPFNALNLATSEPDGDNRTHQFGWSCRVLQELSESGDGLAGFLEGLCPHNSRFIFPDINLATFVYSVDADRQSFACYTSNERTVEHLMQKESKLQVDTLALAQRETEYQEKVKRFEHSKAEHQSILKRESEIRMKEKELLQREQTHALEVRRLEKMEKDLLLRESRLEQRMRSLNHVAPNAPAPLKRSPMRQLPQQLANAEQRGNNEAGFHTTSLQNESGRKTKFSNPPTPRYSQLLAGEETSQEADRLGANTKVIEHMLPIPSPRKRELVAHPRKSLEGGTSISPKITPGHKRRRTTVQKSPPMGHTNKAESASQQEDFHRESQESHESLSNSAKRRKRQSTRKSPKCSLLTLPRSPQKSPSPPKSSSKRQPKKVLITFGDESDSE